MATFIKYDSGIEQFFNKVSDGFGNTDTWKVAIATDAPVVASDTVLADHTQISGTNGYTTGGASISFNSTRTGGTITATTTDVVFTASGGNLGSSTSGRYFPHYDDTPTSPADPLAWYYDYGSTFTVADGETMTVDYGASVFTAT